MAYPMDPMRPRAVMMPHGVGGSANPPRAAEDSGRYAWIVMKGAGGGASSGNVGGDGAVVVFRLDTWRYRSLRIKVGQGGRGAATSAGGGGRTEIANTSGLVFAVAGAGAGGSSAGNAGGNAGTTTGTAGTGNNAGSGGTQTAGGAGNNAGAFRQGGDSSSGTDAGYGLGGWPNGGRGGHTSGVSNGGGGGDGHYGGGAAGGAANGGSGGGGSSLTPTGAATGATDVRPAKGGQTGDSHGEDGSVLIIHKNRVYYHGYTGAEVTWTAAA